jgi:hypothetical protein
MGAPNRARVKAPTDGGLQFQTHHAPPPFPRRCCTRSKAKAHAPPRTSDAPGPAFAKMAFRHTMSKFFPTEAYPVSRPRARGVGGMGRSPAARQDFGSPPPYSDPHGQDSALGGGAGPAAPPHAAAAAVGSRHRAAARRSNPAPPRLAKVVAPVAAASVLFTWMMARTIISDPDGQ